MAQLKGIDISRWQGNINWDEVKKAVDFAIIKASGGDDGLYPDGQFARNKAEARRVGILRGYYHFAGGVHSPEEEADHFVNTVGDLQKGEIMALDWEVHHSNPVDWCLKFLQRVETRVGFKPVIYMNSATCNALNWGPVIANNNGLWIANWGSNNGVPGSPPSVGKWPFWAIWQYSSSGSVAGIAGRVDMDVFNGDATAFKKYGGDTGTPTPPPTPPPLPPTPPTDVYTVKPGDTLTSIGAQYGTNWQTIYAMNRDIITDPNKIYPGQILKVPAGDAPVITTYVVKPGDTLSGIAARYGTTWQQLYAWNRSVIGPNPNLIKPDQVLRVR